MKTQDNKTKRFIIDKSKLPLKEIISLYTEKSQSCIQIAEILHKQNFGSIKALQSIVSDLLKTNNITLRPRSSIRCRGKLSINVHYFDAIDTQEKAYWAGFVLAEGHIRKGQKRNIYPNRLAIGLKTSDSYMLENFKKAIGSGHKVASRLNYDKRTGKTYLGSSIQIYSVELCAALIKLGIGQEKSHTGFFPNIPKEFYASFIRGQYCGDGFCGLNSADNLRINFIATEPIAKFMINHFKESFGSIQPQLHLLTKNNLNLKQFYYSNRYDVTKILDYLYKDSTPETRLDRKYQLYQEFIVNDPKGTASKYRWIYFYPPTQKWAARIYPTNATPDISKVFLGYFDTEDEAYQAQQEYIKENNIIL